MARSGVPDAVTAVGPHDGQAVGASMRADHLPNVAEACAWPHNCNGLLKALQRCPHQVAARFVRVAHNHRLIEVA